MLVKIRPIAMVAKIDEFKMVEKYSCPTQNSFWRCKNRRFKWYETKNWKGLSYYFFLD